MLNTFYTEQYQDCSLQMLANKKLNEASTDVWKFDDIFLDSEGFEVWKSRFGKYNVTTKFKNVPSNKAKKDFNDIFNEFIRGPSKSLLED